MVKAPVFTIHATELTIKEAAEAAKDAISAVGHADTANLLSGLLGREVAVNRVSLTLDASDTAIVAQYQGQRLPEGATALPEGASFRFLRVSLGLD